MPRPEGPRLPTADEAAWDEGIDLRRYLGVFIRQWRPLTVIVLAALGAGLVLSLISPTVYEGAAILQLSEQSDPLYASPPAAVQVASSLDFLATVADAAGGAESAAELRGAITASTIRDTRMVRIRARHRDPVRARDLARVAVNQLQLRAAARIVERERIVRDHLTAVEGQLGQVDRLLSLSRGTLAQLERARPAGQPESGFAASFALDAATISQELRERLTILRTALRRELADLQFPIIVEASTADARPVARSLTTTVVLAGILGVIVGGTAALFIEYFGRRPRSTAGASPGFAPPDPLEPRA